VANYALLNGQLIKREDAYISCQDRGFRFGDGVFTTIALIEQTPIFWELHQRRLELGLQILHINQDISNLSKWVAILITKNNAKNGILRIIITRGEGSKGYLPTNQSPPNIYMEIEENPSVMHSSHQLHLGVSKWRKIPPNCLPNNSKIMQGLNPTLAKMEAISAGYDEALMLSYDGFISEASSSNIFWLEESQLYTPPLSTGCLNGIMRQKIMATQQVEEKNITLEQLMRTSTAFLTNCVAGIVPISEINKQKLQLNLNIIQTYQAHLYAEINKEIGTFLINNIA
jgi:aminodeoxychorismate lyase